jgi:transposase-like protein
MPTPVMRPRGRFKVSPEVKQLEADAKRAGVSMLTVCREAGVHHDTFGRWRRGAGRPMLDTLRRLRARLDKLSAKSR